MENGEAERQSRSTGEAPERRKQEEGNGRTEGQVAGTGREADERKRIGRGKPEGESEREAPVERLWERNREG